MKIACVAFTYFAYGGLQRDMIAICRALKQAGHEVKLFVGSQQDEAPEGMDMECLHARGFSNHRRDRDCYRRFTAAMQRFQPDCVFGFNKMPGLDAYYAADSCFAHRMQHAPIKRQLPRYKHYADYEAAVFSRHSHTHCFIISAVEGERYRAAYGTPAARLTLLPPGIDPSRQAPPTWLEQRQRIRAAWNVADDQFILLMVGSGFRTKGLDRSIECLAALPHDIQNQTRLFVVGKDDPRRFQSLIRHHGLTSRIEFFGGRSDVTTFFFGADMLIHPAYLENTGTVLLEAMIAGCPVIASGACGYAPYITAAEAGYVIPEPFSQAAFNAAVLSLIQSPSIRQTMSQRGILFGQSADIYHRDIHVVRTLEALAQANTR